MVEFTESQREIERQRQGETNGGGGGAAGSPIPGGADDPATEDGGDDGTTEPDPSQAGTSIRGDDGGSRTDDDGGGGAAGSQIPGGADDPATDDGMDMGGSMDADPSQAGTSIRGGGRDRSADMDLTDSLAYDPAETQDSITEAMGYRRDEDVRDPRRRAPRGQTAIIADDPGQITREQVRRIDEQTTSDVDVGDLRIIDGELRLSRTAAQEEARARRQLTRAFGGREYLERREAASEEARTDIEAAIEEQVGRDVTIGEDFTVQREGGQYTIDYSEEFLEEQAGRDIEARQGRRAFGAAASVFAPSVAGTISARLPADVARDFSPIQADEDFTVDLEGDTAEVEFTESFVEGQRERQRQRQAAEDAGGGVMDTFDFVVSDPVGAVIGPPGTLERETTSFLLADDPGEVADFIVGEPGSVESAAGDVAFEVRDISASAAGTVGPVVGDVLSAPIRAPERIVETYTGQEADVSPEGETFRDASANLLQRFGEGGTQATIGAPAGAVDIGDLTASAGEFTAREIEEEGLVEGGLTAGAAGGAFAAGVTATVAEQATTNPVGFVGTIGGGLIGGVGAARTFERVTTAARVRAQTRGDTVDFEDITTERGAQGELPEFETDAGAPTEEAVTEIRRRAVDQPEELQADLGESILFRSEAERLPGDVEAGLGQYELPGLFASPDASPLRLDIGAESSLSGLRPRLPRPFASPQRLSAFETPDIEGMPQTATGSAIVRGPEGDLMPDPTTGGAQFLTREADPGTAYVRPTGSRTTELEAIYPPGSQFVRESSRAVDVPRGDPATLDIYRRVDVEDADVDVPEESLVSLEELSRRRSRSGTPDGQPVTPFVTTSTTTPTTTTLTTSTTSTTGVSGATATETFISEELPEESVSSTSESLASEPLSSGPSGTSVSEPTGVSTTPTSPPTTTPTSPPSTPPSSPPSSPPGTPTSPPTTPLGPPSGPPTRPPRFDSERDESRRRRFGAEESDFLEEYEYGVADPNEVLRGEEL